MGLKWAKNVDSEDEIIKEEKFLTKLGKNKIVSFLIGLFLFIDTLFPPSKKDIGAIIEAKK